MRATFARETTNARPREESSRDEGRTGGVRKGEGEGKLGHRWCEAFNMLRQ